MTSDGISDRDWERVKEFSAEVAQAQTAGNEALSDALAQKLLDYLVTLEGKYGNLASILATRADYVEDESERVRLLEKAWLVAREKSDWANCVFVASSLAATYIEEIGSFARGLRWIRLLDESLERHWDEDEYREMQRLKGLNDARNNSSS